MRKNAWVLAAAVSASLGSFSFAQSTPAETTDVAALKAQIDALQQKVEKIQVQQAKQAEVTATTAAVAADAAKQSQMLQTQPFTAGYNNGFKIQSADGAFTLQPGLIFQFRNITNWNTDSSDINNGFEFRRLRPRMDGTAFSKDLKYSVVLDTGRNANSVLLLDAWVSYAFTKEWGVKIGQFRNSYVHEGDVSDTRQLAVERSIIDATLTGSITDRVQGIEGSYNSSEVPLQLIAAFHDGDNSKNTDFRDSDGADATTRVDSNFGVSGRAQYKVFGNWDNYKDLTGKGVKEDLLVFGAGFDSSQNGDATVSRGVVDVQYENIAGWSAFGQGVVVYSGVDDSLNYGAGGQVGYLINPKVEVFGRYSFVKFEEDVGGEDLFHEITAGANYYFGPDGAWGYNVKFSVDLNYLPSGSPGNLLGVGYLAGDDSQVVVRAQLQLVL